MIARCLRHRAPVLWLLLPFMGGIVAARTLTPSLPVGWPLGAALLCVIGATIWSAQFRRWALLIAVALLCAGAGAYLLHRARIAAWDKLPPREARLTLQVERTFNSDPRRLSGIARIRSSDTHLHDLRGQRVYFSLTRASDSAPPSRDTEIAVIGVIETLPLDAAMGSFEGFLNASGVNFRLTRGRVLSVVREPSAYARFRERSLARFGAILSLGLDKHDHLAGVFRAMLLGQKHELSEDQRNQYLRSGTMHLFAISGLHIGVIALAIHGSLALLRLPALIRFLIGVVALWLYVDITGASPSAVRAFLMITLAQAAMIARLPINPVATLALAAFVGLLRDPMQLFSASFQMSYGTVAAIVLLGLPLAAYWDENWALFRDLPKATWSRWHRAAEALWRVVRNALAIGLATTLVSSICGVIFFQLFTPGGLLANLLLIPVSSLAILSGFLSLVCGLAGWAGGAILFNHAAAIVLVGMDAGIAWLLKIPGFFWTLQFRSGAAGYLSLALVIGAMIAGYALRWERRGGGFWAPFVLTGLALVLGVHLG